MAIRFRTGRRREADEPRVRRRARPLPPCRSCRRSRPRGRRATTRVPPVDDARMARAMRSAAGRLEDPARRHRHRRRTRGPSGPGSISPRAAIVAATRAIRNGEASTSAWPYDAHGSCWPRSLARARRRGRDLRRRRRCPSACAGRRRGRAARSRRCTRRAGPRPASRRRARCDRWRRRGSGAASAAAACRRGRRRQRLALRNAARRRPASSAARRRHQLERRAGRCWP